MINQTTMYERQFNNFYNTTDSLVVVYVFKSHIFLLLFSPFSQDMTCCLNMFQCPSSKHIRLILMQWFVD